MFLVIVDQFNLSVVYWLTIRKPTPRDLVGLLYVKSSKILILASSVYSSKHKSFEKSQIISPQVQR